MIAHALSIAALTLCVAARADVSDSGNLTIGGDGVIQGTMTVQGNAFSVGGATFSVSGGSVTLGGRLNASPEGVKWADGTISTTAGGGGGGDASLSATQSWTGGNTFLSTLTVVGPSNVCDGGGVLVSSGTLSPSTFRITTSMSFSTRVFHLDYVVYSTAAVNLQAWFNNSTTKLYGELDESNGNAGVASLTSSGYSTLYAVGMSINGLATFNYVITPNTYITGRMVFQTTSSTTVRGRFNSTADSNSGASCGSGSVCAVSGHWEARLSAPPTRLDFCTSTVRPAVSVPDCVNPMSAGYWKLCADGWTSGT